MDRPATACKAVAVGRMDRNRRTPVGTERRSAGTATVRTDLTGTELAGTGLACTRTGSPEVDAEADAEAPADRSRARSDRLCCRPRCLAPRRPPCPG